jgi:DNA-binding NtrC family response regulator
MSLAAMEKHLIAETLRRHGGNRKRAARDLGIDTSTLFRKVKALGIDTPDIDGRGRRR